MEVKKNVCVDFDGVLAKYDGWKGATVIGDPFPGVKEFMDELSKKYDVIVHTTRANEPEGWQAVYLWLINNNIKYYKILPKPIAVAYIDDRAVYCNPARSGDYTHVIVMLDELDPISTKQDTK
jgi:hypothetical protein